MDSWVQEVKTLLFTTDISGLQLIKPDGLCVPQNRIRTEKVTLLVREAKKTMFPVFVQPKDCKELSWPFDLGISWFYTMIFQPELIASFPRGIINFHAGPAGAHALLRAIKEGHKEIELKWHKVIEEVDAGETLISRVIQCNNDFSDMRQRLIVNGIEMFNEIRSGL